MEDLDALLADLQNTTAHLSNNQPYRSSPVPEYTNSSYGSLGSPRFQHKTTYSYTEHRVTEKGSPIYQNSQMIRESTRSQSPTVNPNLSSNLSELDTLLEDLNSARFMNYTDKKGPHSYTANGPTSTYSPNRTASPLQKSISPTGSTGSAGIHEIRPSVESLLDELQNAVNNSANYPLYRLSQQAARNPTFSTITYETHRPLSSSPVPTASSATKELDDLMASLSDFKLNATPSHAENSVDAAYARPQKQTRSPTPGSHSNQLDSMLGTLHSDMSKQGVTTTAKGHCAACHKPIVGQVVTALGKTWHPEHFTCTHCNMELGTKNFFERDGEPYCEKDYHNIFSPRCAYCNGPILDKCVTALDKTWHPEHFFCAQCGRQFGEDGFHERDGKPYCREDYFDLFAPKCGGCNQPITENYISALNTQWHPECFVCRDCRQPFNGGSFYDHECQPYCETHYHAKRGSLCAGCHKPITGRCVTAMFRKFHPEHFVCSFCLKQLNKGTFKEQNDKPYCHACFDKLFG